MTNLNFFFTKLEKSVLQQKYTFLFFQQENLHILSLFLSILHVFLFLFLRIIHHFLRSSNFCFHFTKIKSKNQFFFTLLKSTCGKSFDLINILIFLFFLYFLFLLQLRFCSSFITWMTSLLLLSLFF
jgi:hypothetical protein